MRTIYVPKILHWCEHCQNRFSGLDPTAGYVHSDIYSWVQGGPENVYFQQKLKSDFVRSLFFLYTVVK